MDSEIRLLSAVQRLAKRGDLGANYKQGPQGNTVADYYQDFLDRRGNVNDEIKLGSSDIPDMRDNRDPAVIGREVLAQRERERATGGNGHEHWNGRNWNGYSGDLAD